MKRFISVITCLLLMLAFASCGKEADNQTNNQDNQMKYYDEAKAQYEIGNYHSALALINEAKENYGESALLNSLESEIISAEKNALSEIEISSETTQDYSEAITTTIPVTESTMPSTTEPTPESTTETTTKKNNVKVDYPYEALLEADLNNGVDVVGKVVTFKADELHPDSAFGFNIYSGEHLNFVSARNPGIKVGDNVTVEITDVSYLMGSYIISYNLIQK